MAIIPSVTETDIEAWTGERSLELGRRAYRTGALRRMRERGDTLLGLCQGSLTEPYRVEVALRSEDGGIASAACTCGLGAEGRCKHVAALLIAWAEQPSVFIAEEDLDTTLDHLSKESLQLLVQRLMRRTDGLTALVERELPFVTGEVASAERVNIEALRREALTALGTERRAHYDDWPERGDGEADSLRVRMQPLLDLGTDYRARRQYALAAAVYRTVAQAAIDSYEARTDPAGQRRAALGAVVRACSAGLGNCLDGATGAGPRLVTLRALIDIALLNGDRGVDDGELAREILLGRTTQEEREFAAGQVRVGLSEGETAADHERRRWRGELLVALSGAEPGDEARLSVYRETGQIATLILHLLATGRTEEALAEARRVSDVATLISVLNTLAGAGQGEEAARIGRERLDINDEDERLIRWLKDAAERRGDGAEALALATRAFRLAPTSSTYHEMRALAERAGTWPEVRQAQRQWLEREGQVALLAEVCIEDGDLDAALRAFATVDPEALEEGADASLAARLAEAAEASRPDEALQLYRDEAARQIARGGRQRYALAAGYLSRVKALLERLGRTAEWDRVRDDVHSSQGEHRGLAHELRRAGL